VPTAEASDSANPETAATGDTSSETETETDDEDAES
jgi:hypothetical protein